MAYLREGMPIDAWLGSRLGFALDSVLLLEAIITGNPGRGAQSASDPIVPMVVQIGQSSSGIFASAFRSGAPSHAAMEPRHGNSTAAGNS
jgi:hypothetical protein